MKVFVAIIAVVFGLMGLGVAADLKSRPTPEQRAQNRAIAQETSRLQAVANAQQEEAAKQDKAFQVWVKAQNAKTEEQARTLRVAAYEVWQAYEKNEVKAQLSYNGKILIVTGTVKSVDIDAFHNVSVRVRTGNPYESARFDFGSDPTWVKYASELEAGMEIKVKCHKVIRWVGSPTFSKCTDAGPEL